jgi:hypothetical protein
MEDTTTILTGYEALPVEAEPDVATTANAAATATASVSLPQPPPSTTTSSRAKHTARGVVRVTKFLARASFLPMAVDKIRNNVRSMALLVSVYVLAVLLVCAIVILNLQTNDNDNLRFATLVAPPQTIRLGEPWSQFSFQLLDKRNVGVAGRAVYIAMSPLEEVTIQANVGLDQLSTVGQFSCLAQMFLPYGRHTRTYFPACVPQYAELITPQMAVTDTFGVASFTNVTLLAGFPAAYLLVVSLDGSTDTFITQFVSVNTYNVTLTIDPTLPAFPDTLTTNADQPIPPFGIIAEWYAAPLPVPRISLMALRPALAVAAILVSPPLLVDERSAVPVATSPYAATLTSDTAFVATNAFAKTNSIEMIVEEVTLGGLPTAVVDHIVPEGLLPSEITGNATLVWVKYRARLTFTGVKILAANSNLMHFGVMFFGQVIPLRLNALYSPGMSPSHLISPTQVSSIVVAAFAYVEVQSVTEGAPFTVVVRVIDANGRGIKERLPYLALYVGNSSTSATFSQVYNSPVNNLNAKGLIGETSAFPTDASGRATVATRATVVGAIGDYLISATVDGVSAVFVASEAALAFATVADYDTAKASSVQATSCPLVVTSAVGSLVLSDELNADATETVLANWQTAPQVRVLDTQGRPLPGKSMTIAASLTDAATAAAKPIVVSTPQRSDDSGAANFLYLAVASVKSEGSFQFVISVDNVASVTIQRRLRWPLPPGNTSYHGACAIAVPVSVPPRSYGGFAFNVTFDILDIYGNPSPSGQLVETVNTRSIQTPSPVHMVPYSGGAGISITGTMPSVARPLVIMASFQCYNLAMDVNTTLVSTPLALTVLPRVRRVKWTAQPGALLGVIDAEWDLVNAANPITIRAVPAWSPGFVSYYYPSDAQITATVVTITGRQDANVTLKPTGLLNPGLSLYTLLVDGRISTQQFMITQVPTVNRVSILTSAFGPLPAAGTYTNVTISPNQLLPQPPTVQLLNGLIPVGNQYAFAEIGTALTLVDPTTPGAQNNITWVQVTIAPQGVEAAFLGAGSPATPSSAVRPVSNLSSNATGAAKLPTLFLGAADTALYLYVRYCFVAGLDLFGVNNITTQITTCVVEPAVMTMSLLDQLMLIVANVPVVTVAPGGELPPITLWLRWRTRGPFAWNTNIPRWTFAFPVPDSPYLVDSWAVNGNQTDGVRFIVSSNNSFTITGLVLSPQASEYPIKVRFVTPGCSAFIYVVVTATPTAIQLVSLPPPTLPIGSLSSVIAYVGGFNGVPLPNQRVEVTIRRQGEDACTGVACGELSPSSTTFGSTNTGGVFVSVFTITSASTSPYVLVFDVVDRPSKDGVRQLTASQLSIFAAAFGLPTSSMLSVISQLDPRLAITVGIVNKIVSSTDTMAATSADGDGGDDSGSGYSPLEAAMVSLLAAGLTNPDNVKDAATQLSQAVASALYSLTLPSVTAQTPIFNVTNPVSQIVVTQQPSVTLQFSESTSAVNEFLSVQRSVTTDSNSAPRVRLMNANGQPVANATVTFSIRPAGLSATLPPEGVTSDANGVASFAGTTFTASDSGQYFLTFSSRGAVGNTTTAAIQVEITQQSTEETMKMFAFILCACFLPMFLASVQQSWWLYEVFAAVFTLGLAITVIWGVSTYWAVFAKTGFVEACAVFALIMVAALFVGYVAMAAIDTAIRRKRRQNLPVPRLLLKYFDVNGEKDGRDILRYVHWITTTRIDQQQPLVVEAPVGVPIGVHLWYVNFKTKVKATRIRVEQAKDTLEVELLGEGPVPGSPKVVLRTGLLRPALRRPLDVPHCIKTPPNILITIGITLTLTVMMNFLAVYESHRVRDFIESLLAYLPSPADDEDLAKANAALMNVLTTAVGALVKVQPQMSFLTPVLGSLRQIDLVSIAAGARDLIHALSIRILASTAVALVCANTVVLVCCVLTVISARQIVARIRRSGGASCGRAYKSPNVSAVETYIGLHCMHFVAVFAIVAAATFLTMMLLLTEMVRVYIWDKTRVLIVASLSSVALSLGLSYGSSWLLLDDWHIVRPEVHAIYSFFQLVVGVFAGVVGTIVRWAQTIVFFTICFPKLDQPMFPFIFARIDLAHRGFAGVVTAEARYRNPIYIAFSAILLLDRNLKAAIATAEAQRLATSAAAAESFTSCPETAVGLVHASSPVAEDSAAVPSGEATPLVMASSMASAAETMENPAATSNGRAADHPLQDEPSNSAMTSSYVRTKSGIARAQLVRDSFARAAAGNGFAQMEEEREAVERFCSVSSDLMVPIYDFALHRGISAAVLNVMHAMMGDDVGKTFDAVAYVRAARMRKIAARWWLLYILHVNPSLRPLRKERQFHENSPVFALPMDRCGAQPPTTVIST